MKFSPPKAEIMGHACASVVSACKKAFADSLECVTLKGSAVKGDFIQGYSDFDFHVFIKPEAMDGEKNPKVEYAVRFQKAIGDINPKDFGASQFQIYFINSKKYPRNWVPPVGGTYRILWGNLPSVARERSDSTYLRSARQCLLNVYDDKQMLIRRFVDKTNMAVPTIVRLLGVTVKSHMYSVAILATRKPKTVLRTKLDKLIPIVEKEIKSKGCLSAFFEYISNWLKIQQNSDYARDALKKGIEVLDEIDCWAHSLT
jgi:hypothetical protein